MQKGLRELQVMKVCRMPHGLSMPAKADGRTQRQTIVSQFYRVDKLVVEQGAGTAQKQAS